MKKRDFIRIGALGIVGLSAGTMKANHVSIEKRSDTGFSLPKNISSSTTNSVFSNKNYKSHLQSDLVNSNKQLNHELTNVIFVPGSVREIISKNEQFSSKVTEHACTYYNHKLFFKLISGANKQELHTKLHEAIDRHFGSLQAFKNEFVAVSRNLNSDGWVWLIANNNSLKIVSTTNSTNPMISTLPNSQKGFPIIGVDLFKHAYQADYNQNKELYTTTVLDNLNWGFANKRYIRSSEITNI